MNKTYLAILVGVLIVAAGLFFLKPTKKDVTTDYGLKKIVKQVDEKEVFVIEIWKGSDESDKLVLERSGDSWIVPKRFDAPADSTVISTLLSNLKGIEGSERATGKEFFKDFDIQDDKALHFVLKDSSRKEITHIYAGRETKSYPETCFVRTSESETVYSAITNLWREVTFDSTGKKVEHKKFLMKSIFDFEESKVRRIDIKTVFDQIVAEKGEKENEKKEKETIWKLVRPEFGWSMKTQSVTSWLSSIHTTLAEDYADFKKKDTYGFDKPFGTVLLELDDKKTVRFIVGNEESAGYRYAWLEGKDRVFIISNFQCQSVFKKLRDIVEVPQSGIETDKIVQYKLMEKAPSGSVVTKALLKKEGTEWVIDGWQYKLVTAKPKSDTVTNRIGTVKGFTPDEICGFVSPDGAEIGKFSVVLTASDGKTFELKFGKTVSDKDSSRYVQCSWLPSLWKTEAYQFNNLYPYLSELVEFGTNLPEGSAITEFTLAKNSVTFAAKKVGNEWKANVDGFQFQVDSSKISEMVGRFKKVEILDVYTGEAVPAESDYTFKTANGDFRVQFFKTGSAEPSFVVSLGGELFRMQKDRYETYTHRIIELVKPQIGGDLIPEKVELVTGSTTKEIKLEDFNKLKVDDFLAAKTIEGREIGWQLKLVAKDRSVMLDIFKPKEGEVIYHLRPQGTAAVLSVDKSSLDPILK